MLKGIDSCSSRQKIFFQETSNLQQELLSFETLLTVFNRNQNADWDTAQADRLIDKWEDIKKRLKKSQVKSSCDFIKKIFNCLWEDVKTPEDFQIQKLEDQVCKLKQMPFQQQFFLELSLDFIPDLGIDFINSLKIWLEDPKAKGKKVEAVRKIIECKCDRHSKCLDLSFKGLNSLPHCVGEMTHLEELDLSYNCFLCVPIKIRRLSHLVKINLNNNLLDHIPKWIGTFENLQILDISHNQLSILPENLGDLKKLRIFLSANNKIMTIPDSIGNLLELQLLNLSNNDLAVIPETFSKLLLLRDINLANNQLITLVDDLRKLRNLRHLNLDGNFELTKLPLNLRSELPHLKISIENTNIFGSVLKRRVVRLEGAY